MIAAVAKYDWYSLTIRIVPTDPKIPRNPIAQGTHVTLVTTPASKPENIPTPPCAITLEFCFSLRKREKIKTCKSISSEVVMERSTKSTKSVGV